MKVKVKCVSISMGEGGDGEVWSTVCLQSIDVPGCTMRMRTQDLSAFAVGKEYVCAIE